jgi:hypothetical protein
MSLWRIRTRASSNIQNTSTTARKQPNRIANIPCNRRTTKEKSLARTSAKQRKIIEKKMKAIEIVLSSRSFIQRTLLIMVVVVLLTGCVGGVRGLSEIVGSYQDGYPGSGYGCDRPCNDGDVNYVIRASLETYAIPGTETLGTTVAAATNNNTTTTTGGGGGGGDDAGFLKTSLNATISMFTRTFTGVGVANESSSSSPFCFDGNDGTSGPMGPYFRGSA